MKYAEEWGGPEVRAIVLETRRDQRRRYGANAYSDYLRMMAAREAIANRPTLSESELNFDLLRRYIARGSMRLVHIDAIPRSRSTALLRSLGEAPESGGYLNEPINQRAGIDTAIASLLAMKRKCVIPSRPVFLTKVMSRRLQGEDYKRWAELSKNVIHVVRHPLVQLGSFATAEIMKANPDLSPTDVSPYDVYDYWNATDQAYVESDYVQTGWSAMHSNLTSAESAHKSWIVDGEILVDNPERTISALCERLDLTYSADMVDDWRLDFRNMNSVYRRIPVRQNPWVTTVANSSGIVPHSRDPLSLERLPDALQAHVQAVAEPTYQLAITSDRLVT